MANVERTMRTAFGIALLLASAGTASANYYQVGPHGFGYTPGVTNPSISANQNLAVLDPRKKVCIKICGKSRASPGYCCAWGYP